ncbi:MAG: helix-turn-helix domain-containing protein [Acidobacteriota bacterium]|nr:helix-turn-helix domain-containing protein [Acidobacteriota bacterium]
MSKSKSSAELRREFGRWLREQRKSRGIRQKYVAEKAKITVTQLSRIENGRSSTRRDTVIDLAQIIGIDEREALRHFTPESFPQLPKELENIPFSEFSKQELKEIADFIIFKLSQKQQELAAKGEPDKIQAALPDSTGDVQPYRVKNGRLISDTDTEEKEHTNQKPADE